MNTEPNLSIAIALSAGMSFQIREKGDTIVCRIMSTGDGCVYQAGERIDNTTMGDYADQVSRLINKAASEYAELIQQWTESQQVKIKPVSAAATVRMLMEKDGPAYLVIPADRSEPWTLRRSPRFPPPEDLKEHGVWGLHGLDVSSTTFDQVSWAYCDKAALSDRQRHNIQAASFLRCTGVQRLYGPVVVGFGLEGPLS